MSVLLCDNISKNYASENKMPISNFSFNFLDKKIYGILGKSDSGKETLLDMIAGNINPTSGVIWVDGEKLSKNSKVSNRVCYIKKDTTYPKFLKINAIFKYMETLYPKWDNFYANNLCRHFDIDPNHIYGSLEENKKHILIGICSLASMANITVYDDPVSEVDIKDRYDFFNFLYDHHQRYPRTVIIVTDHIDEINYLFDKVLFLDKGKLIDFFTSNELINNFRYLTGKTEVLKSLIKGIKIIGQEERNGMLTVCVCKKLSKDEKRKFQKYLINISDVPIQKIFIYLINLREHRTKKNNII